MLRLFPATSSTKVFSPKTPRSWTCSRRRVKIFSPAVRRLICARRDQNSAVESGILQVVGFVSKADSYQNSQTLTHAARSPTGTSIAKTYGGPMGYRRHAQRAADESVSPQSGINRSFRRCVWILNLRMSKHH